MSHADFNPSLVRGQSSEGYCISSVISISSQDFTFSLQRLTSVNIFLMSSGRDLHGSYLKFLSQEAIVSALCCWNPLKETGSILLKRFSLFSPLAQ